MHQHYKDILDRIAEPPVWFDEHGVPRFGDFSPRNLSNIYASSSPITRATQSLLERCSNASSPTRTSVIGTRVAL